MSRLETWDALENAIGSTVHMVELLQLAREHSDETVDFAINDVEARVASVKEIFYKLHAEAHGHGAKRTPLAVVAVDVLKSEGVRAKDPRRSQRARDGWKKRKAKLLTGRSHRVVKVVEGGNVIPLR